MNEYESYANWVVGWEKTFLMEKKKEKERESHEKKEHKKKENGSSN